ncbi:MAG: hypothetical protein RBS24_01005 [Bacilli bacterium]|nr:hypothetical protein [Bacilli bacterium]
MLTAVFITGKLGEIESDYRYIYVEKVPEPDYDEKSPLFDKFKVKMWSYLPGILHKMKDGTMVTIKGRLEEQDGETFVIAELIRGV